MLKLPRINFEKPGVAYAASNANNAVGFSVDTFQGYNPTQSEYTNIYHFLKLQDGNTDSNADFFFFFGIHTDEWPWFYHACV